MLPARHRLRDRRDFTVAVRGKRVGNRLLVVHASRPVGRRGLPPRAGLAVSRAVGNAVTRNRIKRVLRAELATLLPLLPDGTDLVVRAQPSVVTARREELSRALAVALARALRGLDTREGVAP